jgi:hypothetical protein
MIRGLITGKDVLWHTGSIVRSYGFRRYLRCVRALFIRRSRSAGEEHCQQEDHAQADKYCMGATARGTHGCFIALLGSPSAY